MAALVMMSFTIIPAQKGTISTNKNINVNLQSITVEKITPLSVGGFAFQTKSAQIDWDDMTLYIDEGSRKNQPYTVRKNPYKGYNDDPRGKYSYCASDYYFNR